MNLLRTTCKKVIYGLRSDTINQRLKKSALKFDVHYNELSKVRSDPNLENKMVEEVRQVAERFHESVNKLAQDVKHFMEHEEPNLMSCNMFRNSVTPTVAFTMSAGLVGSIAYNSHLTEKYKALEKLENELLAETASK